MQIVIDGAILLFAILIIAVWFHMGMLVAQEVTRNRTLRIILSIGGFATVLIGVVIFMVSEVVREFKKGLNS